MSAENLVAVLDIRGTADLAIYKQAVTSIAHGKVTIMYCYSRLQNTYLTAIKTR